MARSHYRGTVYGNQPTGAKPLPGAAIRLFHPDTGQPWALPVYPDPVNGVPYSLPIYTTVDGELELWADEPARVSCHVTHRAYHGVGEVIEIRPDPETQATDEDVEESVEDHEAKADPHDQYLTQQEGDELYKPLPWEPDLTGYYTKGEADDEFLDQDEADLRYEQLSRKGMPNGYVPLDLAGYVPNQYLPPLAITETFVVTSEAEMLALDAQTGDVCVRLDTIENFILAQDPASVLANWTKLATSSVAGNTTVLRREEFTPTAGATSVTLALAPTTLHAVDRNGVGQSQGAGHYSLSGVVVTFSDTFAAGERVAVVYEIGSSTPAPINGYTKEESDLRYEPIDTMYTKSESDLRYLQQAAADTRYLQLIGGTLSGTLNAPALNIASKPVNVSPDSGNALVWRANGFYSSGSGGNVTVVNREEFFPAAAATTVTLAQAPTELLSVSRNGVDQFAGAGDYSLAGAVITFSDAFVAGERVSVLSEVGTSVPVDAYTTAQSEARYVNVTGDVMNGVLQVNANVGVGRAPDAWGTNFKAISLGVGGSVSATVPYSGVALNANSYADSGGLNRAVRAGDASTRLLVEDTVRIFTAPAVAAGAQQTFTTRVTVAQTGTVTINPDIATKAKGLLSAGAVEAQTVFTRAGGDALIGWGNNSGSGPSGGWLIGMPGMGYGLSDSRLYIGWGLQIAVGGQYITCDPDNYHLLGLTPTNRFQSVAAVNGTIQTSALAMKEAVTPLDPVACYQAVKDVRWYDFTYLAPDFPGEDFLAPTVERLGLEGAERTGFIDAERAQHAERQTKTAFMRHQRGYVLPALDAEGKSAVEGYEAVPTLFGLDDRQSTNTQADLATLGCALQEVIRRLEALEAARV